MSDVRSSDEVTYERLNLRVEGIDLVVAVSRRAGTRAPIVFLHGFGSTNEDYVDIAYDAAFAGRPFLAYDAPGCGETDCEHLSEVSIPFLVDTARALLLADHDPGRVLSFVDIEGNVAPEDCFLSRQVVTYPSDDAQRFFDDFI